MRREGETGFRRERDPVVGMLKGDRGANDSYHIGCPRQTVSGIDKESPACPVTRRMADEDFHCVAAARVYSSYPQPPEDAEVHAIGAGPVLRPLPLRSGSRETALGRHCYSRGRRNAAFAAKAAGDQDSTRADIVPDRVAD